MGPGSGSANDTFGTKSESLKAAAIMLEVTTILVTPALAAWPTRFAVPLTAAYIEP